MLDRGADQNVKLQSGDRQLRLSVQLCVVAHVQLMLVGYAESTVTLLTGLQTDIYNFNQHLVTELSAWSTRHDSNGLRPKKPPGGGMSTRRYIISDAYCLGVG